MASNHRQRDCHLQGFVTQSQGVCCSLHPSQLGMYMSQALKEHTRICTTLVIHYRRACMFVPGYIDLQLIPVKRIANTSIQSLGLLE